MKATELIGKKAVRTQPIYHISDGGFMAMGLVKKPDYTYTTEPIKILKATDSHIIVERDCFDGTKKQVILNILFCDDNWCDYDELIALSEEG